MALLFYDFHNKSPGITSGMRPVSHRQHLLARARYIIEQGTTYLAGYFMPVMATAYFRGMLFRRLFNAVNSVKEYMLRPKPARCRKGAHSAGRTRLQYAPARF